MRYECLYNPELGAVIAVTHDMADLTQLLEMLDRIAELCKQEATANIIVDHSDLDPERITMENIETLGRTAASLRDIFKSRKCAHVVASDLQFGLVRAWEIIAAMYDLDDLDTRVFKNRGDANEWIKAGT
jgi:hypothetical protein